MIDTHIHLYDPSRPQGVPWPPKTNTLIYKSTLPSRLREVTKGLGVVGAVEVECSPWLEDNQWVLDVAAKDNIIVGMVGNLEPDKPEFRSQLARFAKNPLYRGIRYGYLWDRNLADAIRRPAFVDGLKELAKMNLALDTANPSMRLLDDVIRINDLAPDLRVVMDHLPALAPKPEERAAYLAKLKELGKRPNVFVKLSAVLRQIDSKPVSYQLKDHKAKLDLLFETFGPDRVMYGSDWPNSDPSANYTQVLTIVQEYFHPKGKEIAEKYFWRNSQKVYRWVKRDASQPA
ncbi:MAG: amidohydrolase family protein [Bryobacterales bacterium]|nr:amidohydrolase family protein [Bryobacterales bacterium]